MKSTANTVKEYLDTLQEERQNAMAELRNVIIENLPNGFEETMAYGMIGYVVPHKLYPNGYHCDPKQALPFINIASQKNFIALYHMGIYSSTKLLKWFVEEYPKHCKTKLDMGKSCIRFKKFNQIPFKLIGELASKITVEKWIEMYANAFVTKKKEN
jgi:hypothetical protein